MLHEQHKQQSSLVSPELARGDTEELQLGTRLSDENQKLAAEVAALRLRMEAMAAKAESQQPVGGGRANSLADGQRPAPIAGLIGVSQVESSEFSDEPEGANSRGGRSSPFSPNSRSEQERLKALFLNPEESIRAIAATSTGGRLGNAVQVHRNSTGSQASAVEVGIEALLASPSSSGGGGGREGNTRESGVYISSNSSNASDVLGTETARLIEEETEEILAKLKANPPPEIRALLRVRQEAELFAAAARARCAEIERLPPPASLGSSRPRPPTAASDDEHSPVNGMRQPRLPFADSFEC